MRFRVFVVLFLFVLRLLPGWIETGKYRSGDKLRLRGNVVKIEQRGSKCVGVVGRFWVEMRGKCEFSQYNKVYLVGRVRFGLIDRFLGRVWLDTSPKDVKVAELDVQQVDRVSVKLIFDEWRENLTSIYRRLLPEPEASLTAGVVLGQKRLPFWFYQELIKSGTVHIIVASGYNVMIVGEMILVGLLSVLVRRKASLLAIGVMFLYALLSGFEPPVVRAVIMGAVVIGGKALGRRGGSLWSLFLAVWLMLMVEPIVLLSVSFQLSVMASIGLMVLAPRLERVLQDKLRNTWLLFVLRLELVPTLSAQIMTAPLIWWYFGRVSLIAPVSNVLILPLVPVLMGLGGILLSLGVVWLSWGELLAWSVYAVAHLLVVLVGWVG